MFGRRGSIHFNRKTETSDLCKLKEKFFELCDSQSLSVSKRITKEFIKRDTQKDAKAKLCLKGCDMSDSHVINLIASLSIKPVVSKLELDGNMTLTNESLKAIDAFLQSQILFVQENYDDNAVKKCAFLGELSLPMKPRPDYDLSLVTGGIQSKLDMLRTMNAESYVFEVLLTVFGNDPITSIDEERFSKIWTAIFNKNFDNKKANIFNNDKLLLSDREVIDLVLHEQMRLKNINVVCYIEKKVATKVPVAVDNKTNKKHVGSPDRLKIGGDAKAETLKKKVDQMEAEREEVVRKKQAERAEQEQKVQQKRDEEMKGRLAAEKMLMEKIAKESAEEQKRLDGLLQSQQPLGTITNNGDVLHTGSRSRSSSPSKEAPAATPATTPTAAPTAAATSSSSAPKSSGVSGWFQGKDRGDTGAAASASPSSLGAPKAPAPVRANSPAAPSRKSSRSSSPAPRVLTKDERLSKIKEYYSPPLAKTAARGGSPPRLKASVDISSPEILPKIDVVSSHLDLSNNKLTSFSSEDSVTVNALNKITVLDLNFNNFSSCEQFDFTPLLVLTSLSLTHCQVKGVFSGTWLPLSLLHLNLSHNELTEVTEVSQTHLRIVDVSYNQLTKVDFLPSTLEALSLSNNKIADIFTFHVLGMCPTMRHVCLEENPLIKSCADWRVRAISFMPLLVTIDNKPLNALKTQASTIMSAFRSFRSSKSVEDKEADMLPRKKSPRPAMIIKGASPHKSPQPIRAKSPIGKLPTPPDRFKGPPNSPDVCVSPFDPSASAQHKQSYLANTMSRSLTTLSPTRRSKDEQADHDKKRMNYQEVYRAQLEKKVREMEEEYATKYNSTSPEKRLTPTELLRLLGRLENASNRPSPMKSPFNNRSPVKTPRKTAASPQGPKTPIVATPKK